MAEPVVTTVIPTCGRANVVERTIRSILQQRGVDSHVVVVNDASTDHTHEVLTALERESDRVRVIHHLDQVGPAIARNAGAAIVESDLLAFCDDDDLWAPTKLAEQVAALESNPDARWSCTGAITIDPNGRVLGHHRLRDDGEVFERLVGTDVIPGGCSSVVMHRSLFAEAGGFDASLISAHDWELWIRLAALSPVAGVDAPLVAYRVWPGAMSWDVSKMERAYHQTVALHSPHAVGSPERSGSDVAFHRYMARMELRNGQRVAVAVRHAKIARSQRQPKDLVHSLISFVAPRSTERWRARHELARVPKEWIADVDTWLPALLTERCSTAADV